MVSDDELDAMERELIAQIDMIRRDYQKQIDPIITQIVRLRGLRPASQMLIPAETYDELVKRGACKPL